MTYELAIGDRSYSSWSLRGWLLFEKFGIPVKVRKVELYSDDMQSLLADFAPARLVPAVRTPEGEVFGETIAIAETLAERHPEAGLWPENAAARAMARYMSSEMHSGFRDLRNNCAMDLLKSYEDSKPNAAVLSDLARIEEIWARARGRFGAGGSWLFGSYSIADAFYAPVAARIATYNLPVSATSKAYVDAHLNDPSFRRWRAMGKAENRVLSIYDQPYAQRPWPGPVPQVAIAADDPSLNSACPYSGKPVTHSLRLNGRVWGFCNAFCRDKTMHDPDVWPAFVAMVNGGKS